MKSKIYFLLALFIFLIPSATFAADFIGLVGIPGIEPNGDTDLNAYINALYRLSISLAALLAVIKIVAAGAKYMLTDIVPAKEDAKKDIQGALIGLLIVIGAIIILNTVNTDLTKLDLGIEGVAIKDEQKLPANEAFNTECADAQCKKYTCSNNAQLTEMVRLSGLSTTSSCRAQCSVLKGYHYKPSDTLDPTCAVSMTDYNEALTKATDKLLTEFCPAGKKCFVTACDEANLSVGTTCKAECEDRGGKLGRYSEATKQCVIEGKSTDIACERTDLRSGCNKAKDECAAQSGSVVWTSGAASIRCDTYTTLEQSCRDNGDTWNNVNRSCFREDTMRAEICGNRLDCKTAQCVVPDTFGFNDSCSSWCNNDQRLLDIGFTGGEYNAKYNVCYRR